jgi:hypothetical protein
LPYILHLVGFIGVRVAHGYSIPSDAGLWSCYYRFFCCRCLSAFGYWLAAIWLLSGYTGYKNHGEDLARISAAMAGTRPAQIGVRRALDPLALDPFASDLLDLRTPGS